jgi:hypothetical protein
MVNLLTARQGTVFLLLGIVLILICGACQSTPTPAVAPTALPPTPVYAAQSQPTPQAVSTVLPPDVAELQKTITEQSIELKALRSEFETYKKEQAVEVRNILWLIGVWSATAAFVAGLFAFYGLRTRNEIKDVQAQIKQQLKSDLEQAERGFRASLDKKLYNLDPAIHPIRVREGHPTIDMLTERQRLTASGFKVQGYTKLGDECRNGITIVPIGSDDDERQFMEDVRSASFDSTKAAFVLYTPNQYRVDKKEDVLKRPNQQEIMKSYGNLAIANMPTTLVSAIIAVARGLEPDRPEDTTGSP